MFFESQLDGLPHVLSGMSNVLHMFPRRAYFQDAPLVMSQNLDSAWSRLPGTSQQASRGDGHNTYALEENGSNEQGVESERVIISSGIQVSFKTEDDELDYHQMLATARIHKLENNMLRRKVKKLEQTLELCSKCGHRILYFIMLTICSLDSKNYSWRIKGAFRRILQKLQKEQPARNLQWDNSDAYAGPGMKTTSYASRSARHSPPLIHSRARY